MGLSNLGFSHDKFEGINAFGEADGSLAIGGGSNKEDFETHE